MINNSPDHGAQLIENGKATEVLQNFLDEIQDNLFPVFKLPEYVVAKLPPADKNRGGLVFVPDETGGAVTCFSDGVDWRRTTDRAIAS